jgi:Fe(II)/alpha-ketoglutarate-dependent arginine beta-hydroxylase
MSRLETLVLDDAERAATDALVDEVFAQQQPWDALAFADEASAVAQYLPTRVRRFLARVRIEQADVAVLSGLPLHADLAPTPTGWEMAAKTAAGQREELLLLVCAAALGDPFAWSDQQKGRMVHDVCPAPGQERSLTSASSEATLSLHTEDVHHPCRGDYVALLCLRNPDDVGTTFVHVDDLDVPEDKRAILSADRFRFFADDSHENTELDQEDVAGRHENRFSMDGSVLFGPADFPYLRIDLDFAAARDGDPVAEEAMRVAFESLRRSVERVVLRPGDLAFLDNYRVVHGREPFNPRYDGHDRWLKRVNLIRDIRRVFVQTRSLTRVIA